MDSIRNRWSNSRLSALLGINYPIVQGPFGGGSSTIAMASAISNCGGLGGYGAQSLSAEQIRDLVAEFKTATTSPFAVNLWVPLPGEREYRLTSTEFERQMNRLRPYYNELNAKEPEFSPTFGQSYDSQIELLLESRPPAISFIMGVPDHGVIEEARTRGIVTIGTATTVDEAIAIEAAGLDAVIASGSDAGGHRGAFLRPVSESLVGTFSLIPQIADAVSIPIIAAGGVSDARGIVAALTLGADGVQVGTAFLVSDESGASPAYRDALLSPDARTTELTTVFSGRTARGIPNRFLEEFREFEGDIPDYPVQGALTGALRSAANEQGNAEFISLWAGQAAALSRPGSIVKIFETLVAETEALLGIDR